MLPCQLSSWQVRVHPLARRRRGTRALRELSLTMSSPPTCHPLGPPLARPMGRQSPGLSLFERPLPWPSYLSQFQEHKDVPIDVHHHLRGFHQPGHGVLLCDTHSRGSAREAHEWPCAHLYPPAGAYCRAERENKAKGKSQQAQERP